VINDINHFWGGDLAPGITGDLLPANGTTRGQQRILRRLLTNPGDYVFQPTYGAGLPGYVGQRLDVGKITALILSQILLEDSVARTPPPQITVQQTPTDLTGLAVTIAYNDATTNTPTVLSFNVSK
jgi:hypothetical protein